MKRKHVNERLKTNFKAQGNRVAGIGITYDRYDDESFPDSNPFNNHRTSFYHKPVKPETTPVKVYNLTDEELEEYRKLNVETVDFGKEV